MLYSFFDADKNGILIYQEVAAALVILCKGSVANKISFAMRAFAPSTIPEIFAKAQNVKKKIDALKNIADGAKQEQHEETPHNPQDEE